MVVSGVAVAVQLSKRTVLRTVLRQNVAQVDVQRVLTMPKVDCRRLTVVE